MALQHLRHHCFIISSAAGKSGASYIHINVTPPQLDVCMPQRCVHYWVIATSCPIIFLQDLSLEQVLSRVEDAILMLQGSPYMLAEKGVLLQARRRRLPTSVRVIALLTT